MEFYLPIIRRCPSEAHQQQTHTHTRTHTLAFHFIAGRLLLLYYFSSFITHSFNWSHRVCVCLCSPDVREKTRVLLEKKKNIHAFYIITHIIHIIYHIRNNNIMLWHGGGCRSGREQKKKKIVSYARNHIIVIIRTTVGTVVVASGPPARAIV